MTQAVVGLTEVSTPIAQQLSPDPEIRRQNGSSLADLDLGNGSLRKVVQDCTQGLNSKEIGFMGWVFDVLKGLFDMTRNNRSLEEIRTALKVKIPTLARSKNPNAGSKLRSFTFPGELLDKSGNTYSVMLSVGNDGEPESLKIYKTTPNTHASQLLTTIPLTGEGADAEFLKLIKENPNILPGKK